MAFAIISLKSANNNPYFRLDASLLEQHRISNILKNLREHGLEFATLNELGFQVWNPPRMAMKKLRLSKTGLKTLFVGVGIAKKISINLSKIEIGYVPNENYLISEGYILAPETGEPACGYVFEGAIDALHSYYDDKLPLAATHNLFRITCESCREELKGYIALLLNTSIGLSIIGFAKYGALQPHYRADILAKTPLPLLERGKHCELLNKALDHEAKAWRSYFKAMKIVEEYLNVRDIGLTSISSLKIMKDIGRIDATMHILLSGIISRLGRGNIHYINKLYDVISGTAPSSRKYERPCKGQKYISTKSIDESGYIDEESFYCYPGELRTRNLAKRSSLVVLKNAHTVEALGKMGIVYPYDNMPAISDLYILNLKHNIENDVSFYIIALSKTKFFKHMIQSLAYGLTAHIKAEDLARVPIPFINQWKNVARCMKEFVENMYQANALKRQAIAELENYILELVS